jgi:hypothetical protein
MGQIEDEPNDDLLEAVKRVITGQSNDQVIPVLLVAIARALVIDADGDPERLEQLGEKFCALLSDSARDMMETGVLH